MIRTESTNRHSPRIEAPRRTARLGALALAAAALVVAADPAGATQFRPVLADTVRESDPTPSPDGKWLAFTKAKTGFFTNLWVMPIEGGEARQLTDEPDSARAMTPTWAPDSKSLLYISTRGRQYNVYSVPLEGGTPRRLTYGPGSQRFASYSPDGAAIVFASNRHDPTSLYGYNLFMMGPDGDSTGHFARQITKLNGSPGHPTWSPDGKWIGFVSKDVDTTKVVTIGPGMQSTKNSIFATYRVFKVGSDGGKPVQLTGLTAAEERDEDVWPTWSPTGEWIAVAKRVGTKNDVWLVDPEGKRPSVQVTTGGNCSKPTWSHDGKQIWYTVFDRGNEDIWVASDITIPPPPPPPTKAPSFKPVPSGKASAPPAKTPPANTAPAKTKR
jgi:Tol biopolymer transport system component